MKKILSLSCTLIIILGCVLSLNSCGKITGVYEMTSLTGTMTVDGVTTELSADNYEYYTINLREDGTAILRSKIVNRTPPYTGYYTWEYEGTTLTLTNLETENVMVMTMEDGVITYTATNANINGGKATMTMILEK